MAQGANCDKISAAGRIKKSLFFNEPFAIRRMIGSSRSAGNPTTYFGVTAASSTTTPNDLALAFAAAAAISSADAAAVFAINATSSNKANNPELISRSLFNNSNSR